MRRLLSELSRIDNDFMAVVYTLNILTEAAYFYVILQAGYAVHEYPFFFYFYAASGGAIIVVTALLLGYNLRKSGLLRRMHLLLWVAALQAVTIVVDIAFAVLHGDFWIDGYVFLILELFFLAAYARRYLVLKKAEDTILTETDREVHGNVEP